MSTDGSKSWVANKQVTIQGFEHLYNRYFPRLYAYIRYRVGRVQDAEDLVAETFLKVVQELDHFEWRGENAFSAWLFRIAHNLVSDFFRRSQRREVPLPMEELPQSRAANPTPDDVVLQEERFADLRRLIATLSPRRQEVITLKFFSGLRNKEVAQVLGLDERTVASHLCRGLEDLHRKYVEALVPTKEGEVNERTE